MNIISMLVYWNGRMKVFRSHTLTMQEFLSLGKQYPRSSPQKPNLEEQTNRRIGN